MPPNNPDFLREGEGDSSPTEQQRVLLGCWDADPERHGISMIITRKGCVRSLYATLALSAVFITPVEAQQPGQVIGDWVLSKKGDVTQKRQVTFEKQNGQLTGYYRTRTGKRVRITGARFVNNSLSFQVPSVNLTFRKGKFANGRLEGELIDANPGSMQNKPQAVQLVRLPKQG
jgi:hypothetical protein